MTSKNRNLCKLILTLLVVVLTMSVMTVVAFAAETNDETSTTDVAEVNGVKYDNLQAAIDAAADGETVTVIANIEATVMPVADRVSASSAFICIPTGKTVTLDLNGKTVSVTGDAEALYDTLGILNYGNLTIEDSANGGKFTFVYDGAKEVGTSQIHSTILNFGTLVVNGGTFENNSVRGYGKYTVNNYSWGGNADVTINGGVFSNAATVAVYSDGYSDFGTNSCNLTINDGTFNGGVWYNGRTTADNKTVTINGGTFNEGGNPAFAIRNIPGSASVNGGTFNGVVSITEGLQVITGGTFTTDVSDFVADGYEIKADGTVGEAKTTTAEVSTWEDLAAAVADAEILDIVLTADITATGRLVVERNLHIDLNGNTLYLTQINNRVWKAAILTIDGNGKIDVSAINGGNAFYVGSAETGAGTNGNLVLNNIEVFGENYNTGTNAAIFMLYGPASSTLSINNCELNLKNNRGNGSVFYDTGTNNQCKINIVDSELYFDGTVRGSVCGNITIDNSIVVIKNCDNGFNEATLTIKNGSNVTITDNTGRGLTINRNGYGIVIEDSTVVLANNGEGDIRYKASANIEIINSNLSLCNVVVDSGKNATINGAAVADGVQVESVNGVVSIVVPATAVQVGNKYYATLQEAIDAAQEGETITLLTDLALEDTLIVEKSVIIDGNGFKVVPADASKIYNSAFMLGNSGWGDNHGVAIAVRNVKFEGWNTNFGVIRAQGITLEVSGCEFTANTVQNDAYAVLSLNYTYATVSNTKFVNNNDRAIDVNYNADSSKSVVVIDGCLFEGNTTDGAGIIYRNAGEKLTIKNCQFINNTVSTNGNAATVYLGWGSGHEIIGCLFDGNTVVTSHATSKRFASAIFADGCNIEGNVFLNNSATRNGSEITTIVAIGAYYGAADLSENYWADGSKPEAGVEYTIEYTRNPVAFENYYTAYENGVLGGLTAPKSPSGNVAYRGYINDSASREAIQIDLENVYAAESLVIKLYDANGNLLTTTTLKAGGIEAANLTCNIVLWGTASGSWNTEIHTTLTVDNVPALAEVIADGVVVDRYQHATSGDVLQDKLGAYKALDCVYKEAMVDNTYYATLKAAIDAAQEGETITLLTDVELTSGIAIAADKNVTLDLAGYNVTMSVASKSEGNYIFRNDGIFTVTDSIGDGEICLTYTGAKDSSVSISTIMNYGTLNVEGGTINCISGNQNISYAIDTLNVLNKDSVVNISGGAVIGGASNYCIRMFVASTTCKNVLNVTGGTTYYVWAQNVNEYANKADISITGGEVAYLYVSAANASATDVSAITLNAKAENLTYGAYVYSNSEAYVLENVDGVYTIAEKVFVAQVGDAKFATLADAIAAAKDGDTVTLLTDVEPGAITVAGKNITLDLAGYSINGTCNANQAYLIYIENNATLTVKDSAGNGKITFTRGTSGTGWTVDVKGVFILESGTIELAGSSWSIGYAVDVRPNSWGTEYKNATKFVMNGGAIISTDGGVRVASSSAVGHKAVSATFVMNGGLIDADWDGVFVQQSDAIYDDLSLTINNGTIKSDLNPIRVYGPAPTGYVNGQNCMDVTLNGGTFTYTGTSAQTWAIEGVIRVGGGSTIETILDNGAINVSAAVAESITAPEGYEWATAEDGNRYLAAVTLFPIQYTNVTITENFKISFAFAAKYANDWTGYYAVITKTAADGTVITLVVNEKDWTGEKINGEWYGVVEYAGVAAKQMNEIVAVTIYNAEGVAVSETRVDSIKDYAMRKLNKSTDAELNALLVDMLNYGAAAQIFFGYDVEHLANSDLTDEQKAYGTADARQYSDEMYSKVYAEGYSFEALNTLTLESNVQIKIRLDLTNVELSDNAKVLVSYVDHKGITVSKEVSLADYNGGYVYVSCDTLTALDHNAKVTFQLVDGESALYTFTTSVEAFTARLSADNNKVDICTALMKYCDSAETYFKNN